MYCEIILSQRFPKSMGIFDYEIPAELEKKIKIGQLVRIPFRQSEKEGVIIKIKSQSITGKKIKAIKEIVHDLPIITDQQIRLAEWMSEYYFISPGTIIKTMLPSVPKKRRELKHKYLATGPDIKIKPKYKKILANKKNKIFYVHNSENDRQDLITSAVLESKDQTLIIMPTINDIKKILKKIPEKINPRLAVITNDLNKTQQYDIWQKILKNEVKIIIGTKLAMFAPFTALRMVVLDQASNQNHKQSDQNPRYNCLEVIDELTKNFDAKNLLLNHALTVNHYQQYKEGSIELIHNKRDTKKATIVDMKQEQLKKNYSIFSDELIIDMNDALEKKEKIFLFINKRGSNSSVICRDCSQSLVCDNCRQSLTYHQTNDTLYCHHCNKKFELPPFCPNCHGPNFKFIGTGTQKVENEIKRIFGDKKINRLDQDDPDTTGLAEAEIIIGTELALSYLNWHSISLVGVISADTFLYLPDYNSAERTWQMLNKILDLAEHNVIIQTYNTEHNVLKYLPDQNEKFFNEEIKNRQELLYPPFSEFIKLAYSNKDKRQCLSQTESLFRDFKNKFSHLNIITPLIPFRQGKWRMYIVLKIMNNDELEKFKKIANNIPEDWTIDRNPYTLL